MAFGPKRSVPHQSVALFAFDKRSGKHLWQIDLERVVAPAAVASDGKLLFVLDRSEEMTYRQMRRRGDTKDFVCTLKAFDLASGNLKWQAPGIHPERKWLLCKQGVVVAVPAGEDPVGADKHAGIVAFNAADGTKLWEHEDLGVVGAERRGAYLRHIFAAGDTLFLPRAFDLKTGEERLPKRAVFTEEPIPLSFSGQNFCGTIAASKHLATYRSACVGFEELDRDSGSFWFPEVRPSCWISVLPVGGIVVAPEGYSTCVCSYNYKTSLALFPEPRQEDWSIYLRGGVNELRGRAAGKTAAEALPLQSLRLNANAPGDKLDGQGNRWFTWPEPWRDKPKRYPVRQLPVSYPEGCTGFLFNADQTRVTGTDTPWLYTSGLTGPVRATLTLGATDRHYTLRFHFAELLGAKPGERVFNVLVQGKPALERVDVCKEAGGANAALVREVAGATPQDGVLTLELKPVAGKPPVLCGVEVLAAP